MADNPGNGRGRAKHKGWPRPKETYRAARRNAAIRPPKPKAARGTQSTE